MRSIIISIILLSGYASAHEFTPTYPKLEQSYIAGVLKAEMELFNSRKDVNYYTLGVFDKDWNPVPFATPERLFKVEYLQRRQLEVYIRRKDKEKALYICSQSKLLTGNVQTTVVSSRICSKIK